jgi:hypothetical protein
VCVFHFKNIIGAITFSSQPLTSLIRWCWRQRWFFRDDGRNVCCLCHRQINANRKGETSIHKKQHTFSAHMNMIQTTAERWYKYRVTLLAGLNGGYYPATPPLRSWVSVHVISSI